MLHWVEQLNESDFVRWLGELLWGFPSAEIFHLLSLATFFGAIVLLDLRILGVNRVIKTADAMFVLLRVIKWAFASTFVSGFILCLFMPLEYYTNPAFLLKMGLILFAAFNAMLMHFLLFKDVDKPVPISAKLSATLSLGIWCVVLACGRLIAYYYHFGF